MFAHLALLPLLLATQTASPSRQDRSVPPVTDPAATKQQGKKMDADVAHARSPDIALIDYLGEYADAADGLDPLGLAEHRVALPPAQATKAEPHR
jgi:hypothetical protein